MTRSIRTRLALVMGALVGAVALFVTLTGRSLTLEVLEVADGAAPFALTAEQEALGRRLEASWSPDHGAIDAWIGLLPEDRGLALVDSAGMILLATPDRWRRARSTWDGETLDLLLDEGGEQERLALAGGRPIRREGRVVATLFLFDLSPGRQTRRSIRPILTRGWATAAALGILFGAVGAWWLAGSLTRRLRDITRAARRLEQGDRSVRIEAAGHDEIGELANTFNALADSLADLEAARRRLVSETAHELRTPLTRLRCQIESVDDGLAQPNEAWVQSLLADLGDLQKLVDDLQELALAESGQLQLDLEELDVAAELQTLIGAAPERGRLRLEVPATDALTVSVDRTRLRQIVSNLIDNALAWSAPEDQVVVEGLLVGREVEIAVRDRGPGIAAAERERIFERFYRADPSRSRESGGAGLGLAIVRRLTEAQGGRVGLDSEIGRGSRFWVRLPQIRS